LDHTSASTDDVDQFAS